jgi:hypothetical protein
MDIKKLREPLTIDDIEFRVQSINKGGYATILAYKNARVDQNRLDDVCGALNWKREHSNGNANCTVSIWNKEIGQWISKEDTGVESMAEKEKGKASDSFKRACFNWGIGRELYNYPIIQIKLNEHANGKDSNKNEKASYGEFYIDKNQKVKQGFGLKIKDWKWGIKHDENGNVKSLLCKDQDGKERFKYPKKSNKPTNKRSDLDIAVEKMNKCKTLDELKAVWLDPRFKKFQSNAAFKDSKELKKKELSNAK